MDLNVTNNRQVWPVTINSYISKDNTFTCQSTSCQLSDTNFNVIARDYKKESEIDFSGGSCKEYDSFQTKMKA